LLETGVALMLECHDPDPSRSSPLCYQVLEKEQIDVCKDELPTEGQNEIKRGIEFDSRGRKVAFWLYSKNPGDPHATEINSERITADRVTYVTLPGRPSETGGVSYYKSTTQSARDLDDYLGSELTAARIGSMLTAVHKTDNPGSGRGFSGDGSSSTTDRNGNKLFRLGRGTVATIGKDDDIQMVDPSRPNSSAQSFVDLIMRLIGMGGGLSKYRMTRDYSGTTYIAAKAAHLDDKKSFRPLQAYFARRICMPVRRRWTERTILANGLGGVTPEQFDDRRRHWLAAEYQTPSWEMLDENKETVAALDRIDGGLSTRKSEAARMNQNWRAIDRQQAREKQNEKDLDLEYGLSRIGTPVKEDDSADAEKKEEVATA
jgi:lambda family phage portal protein